MDRALAFAKANNAPTLARWAKIQLSKVPNDIITLVEEGNDHKAYVFTQKRCVDNSHCLPVELLEMAAEKNMHAFLMYVFEHGLEQGSSSS